jgi:Domain of unknown function (DUF4349)
MGSNHTTGTAGPVTSTTSIGKRRRHRRRFAAALGLAALAISACGGSDHAATSAPSVDDGARSGEDAGGDQIATESGETAPETGGAASAGMPINDFGRDIITNVGLTMSTTDVGQTADDVRRLATANGGAVFSSDITIDDEETDDSVPGGGVIVVRIPPESLDRLVTELDGLGVVSRLSQDSQDVTDQLVDLEVRIRQAEASVERVELLLAEATELGQVFAIETELTTRQVTLEQLRATERNTEDLVALSTLTVQVEYRTPEQLDAIDNGDGIGDGFASGWNAFVGGVFALGYVLAVGAPFLLTALVLAGVAWMLGRRWARRQAAVREQRRIDADLRGPIVIPTVAPYPTGGPRPTPPPPVASDRRYDDATGDAVNDTSTDAITATIERDDHTPDE